MRSFILLLMVVAGLSACDSRDEPFTYVNVLSWDLYRGYDLEALTGATSDEDLQSRTFAAYRNVLLTNFPNRARRISEEIERSRPDVVALQEVALYRTESPSNFAGDPSDVNATQVRLDFLDVLLDSLADRGLSYRVAASVTTSDFELPASTGATTLDIRFTDRDVILVAADVASSIIAEQRYSATGTFTAAGYSLPHGRGYVAVEVIKDDVPIRVYSTQFHDDSNSGAAQRAELEASMPSTGNAVIAGGLGTAPLGATGFADGWTKLRPSEEGSTCCLSPTIDDLQPVFAERSDQIWARGGTFLEISRLGARLRDRLVSGLWPSDHAGLGARILFRAE